MKEYYDKLNDEVKEYFKILSPEFPKWLWEYIDTDEMQRIGKISMHCGTDYTKLFNVKYFYSNLEHSIGVALIIWHFTHDKKQTLAGLFHDIATPTFKHCIDFMNGDSEKQESTEELTYEIIKNSTQIMALLKRDNIDLDDVVNYKKYPIADNDTPKLSADRFEYNFSSGLSFYRVWDLDRIKIVYDNIIVHKNEEGIDELVFKDKEVCALYIDTVCHLWPQWICSKDRITMQFLADICYSMNNLGYLTKEDLYLLTEEEIINRIKNCENEHIKESFNNFINADKVYESDTEVDDKYCINVKVKRRYVKPLVLTLNGVRRIDTLDSRAKNEIENYLSLKNEGWIHFDFDFKPINEKEKVLKKTSK